MYSPIIQKERLDKVYDMLVKAGLITSDNVKIFPESGSKIRIEQPIIGGRSQYVFDLVNSPVNNVTTFGLQRNDVFVPFAWNIMLGIRHKTTGVEKLYTFAPKNDGVAPSAYPVGFANDQIDAIYAGHVNWMLDQTALMSNYAMENFHKVPETQPCFVLNSTDAAVQQSIQLERGLEKDLQLIFPKLILAGTRSHKISVNFDAAGQTGQATLGATSPLVASDYEAFLVLYIDGVKVVNGCQDGDASAFGKAVGNW